MKAFEDTDEAFEDFYDEHVVVEAKKTDGLYDRQTVNVCIFQDMTSDPIADNMTDTDIDELQFIFKKNDWQLCQRLKTGDNIIRTECMGKKYKVTNVQLDASHGYIVRARSDG